MKTRLFITLLFFISNLAAAQNHSKEQLLSAIKGNDFTKVRELVDYGANVNAIDSNLATMLMWAVYKSDLQTVKYLVDKKANIEAKGVIFLNDEKTSYYGNLTGIAAGEGKTDILKYLIETCKINVDDKEYDAVTKTKSGWTALQWAASSGKTEAVKYLIEKKANINTNHSADKGTPLFYAVQNEQEAVIPLLIKNGANGNAADVDGNTVLIMAVINNNINICNQLWQSKVDLTAKNNAGKTALDIARVLEFSRIIEFLQSPEKYQAISSKKYWRDYNDSIVFYYEAKEYAKGIAVGEMAIEAAKNEFGNQSLEYALSLNNMGSSFEKMNEYTKAEIYFIKSIKIRKEILGDLHPTYAQGLHNLAGLYESMGLYKKAELLYLESTTIRKKELGAKHPDYAASINNLSAVYENEGEYDKAEKLYIEAGKIRKEILGEGHIDYLITINNLAGLYERLGKYKNAEPLYIGIIESMKKKLATNEPDYASFLSNLSSLYKSMGLFSKSEPLCIEALNIRKKIAGTLHPDYAVSLNNLGVLYLEMKLYEKAKPLLLEAFETRKKILGTTHPDFATSLNNLAALYKSMNEYEKAEPLYIESKNIREAIFGTSSSNYAESLNSLGQLYEKMGQYINAETLYVQAAGVWKKSVGKNHPDYATCLNNVAGLYKTMGKYDKAELLYLESTGIRKSILGDSHLDYSASLNNLASLYNNLSQFSKAETLYRQSIDIIKKVLGAKNVDYAVGVNNLAGLLEQMGKNIEAEKLYIEALEINKEIFGLAHIETAVVINNLAALYQKMGKYTMAESLLKKALEIKKDKVGGYSSTYAIGLNNLGYVYEKTNKKNLAEKMYLQSIGILRTTVGPRHLEYANVLKNLSLLYQSTGRYNAAESLLLENNAIHLSNLKAVFGILSEAEKNNYLTHTGYLTSHTNSFITNNLFVSDSFLQKSFDQQLVSKSLSLSGTQNMLVAVQNSTDESTQRIFRNWQQNKGVLALQYSLPLNSRRPDLIKMETETEALEKELTRNSTSFKNQQQMFDFTFKKVQNSLYKNEAAIEFVKFDLYNKGWTDSALYAAYIFTKRDSVPIFVPLCEEKQLQKLFDSAGTSATTMVSKFYRGLEIKNKNSTGALGTELYKLIWQPLEPYLKEVKKVSYSPAGKLYSIAFHALPVDSTTVLMDKYQLQQYTSTRQVVLREQENQNSKPQKIALFGDATFTLDSLQIVKGKTKTENASSNIYTPQNRGTRGGTWSNLPGTAQEVKKIQKVFEQNKITTKTFTQTIASEENLKALSGNSPQILHIATHGFFLPEADKKKKENNFNNENTYTLADDPLLRSGLILSGGNYAWSGKAPIDGVEDGIATAYEISQLNLSNTELVVLSACETALGDVKGSEGVFGLQRAFKMAGVKKMIVSLWQVPDKETAELMTSFYGYWMKGKIINDAFTQAQADMRKKYSPFYWAAFVLVE